jgi:hypothetical protein
LVEQLTLNHRVVSSNLTGVTPEVEKSLETSFQGFFIRAAFYTSGVPLRSRKKPWKIHPGFFCLPAFFPSTRNVLLNRQKGKKQKAKRQFGKRQSHYSIGNMQ